MPPGSFWLGVGATLLVGLLAGGIAWAVFGLPGRAGPGSDAVAIPPTPAATAPADIQPTPADADSPSPAQPISLPVVQLAYRCNETRDVCLFTEGFSNDFGGYYLRAWLSARFGGAPFNPAAELVPQAEYDIACTRRVYQSKREYDLLGAQVLDCRFQATLAAYPIGSEPIRRTMLQKESISSPEPPTPAPPDDGEANFPPPDYLYEEECILRPAINREELEVRGVAVARCSSSESRLATPPAP